jgi:hypothetical protein
MKGLSNLISRKGGKAEDGGLIMTKAAKVLERKVGSFKGKFWCGRTRGRIL